MVVITQRQRMPTNIAVSDTVWSYLNSRKGPGDSFDDVLRRELGIDQPDDRDDRDDPPINSFDKRSQERPSLEKRMESTLRSLEVPGRPKEVERDRRAAIKFAWEELRRRGFASNRWLANTVLCEFWDQSIDNKVSASRYPGYQVWDGWLRDALTQLPGVQSAGRGKYKFDSSEP